MIWQDGGQELESFAASCMNSLLENNLKLGFKNNPTEKQASKQAGKWLLWCTDHRRGIRLLPESPRRNWVTWLYINSAFSAQMNWLSHSHPPSGVHPWVPGPVRHMRLTTTLQLLLEPLRKKICRCQSSTTDGHLCHEVANRTALKWAYGGTVRLSGFNHAVL